MQSYTYKEILLGLREEYLKNQQRLDALKKYVSLDNKKEYEEYGFFVFNDGKDKYVELALRQRQSVIVKLIETLSNKIIGESDKKTTCIAHEFNGEMRYMTFPNSKNYSINDMNSLMADADRVLGSEFVQKIATGKKYFEDDDYAFKLSPSNILVDTGYHKADYPPARFLYTPDHDILTIIAYDDPLYIEHVNNVFGYEIPADVLTEYHREIIDNSEDKDKALSITGLSLSRVPQVFKFRENKEENEIVLRRAK